MGLLIMILAGTKILNALVPGWSEVNFQNAIVNSVLQFSTFKSGLVLVFTDPGKGLLPSGTRP